MGRFVKGNVVVVPFPFSDLSGSKRRPALVLADLDGDDILLCQITSNARTDRYAVSLMPADFVSGGLAE
jgi:mRNA interferase MazF